MRRAIIYYGAANELWVQRKLVDLRKAFGLGRERAVSRRRPCSSAAGEAGEGTPAHAGGARHPGRADDHRRSRWSRSWPQWAAAVNDGSTSRRPTSSILSSACARTRSSEAHLFFGRDGQSDELVRRLARKRFVAVVGVSGSGKSSLVRAGLLRLPPRRIHGGGGLELAHRAAASRERAARKPCRGAARRAARSRSGERGCASGRADRSHAAPKLARPHRSRAPGAHPAR